MLFKTNILIAQ